MTDEQKKSYINAYIDVSNAYWSVFSNFMKQTGNNIGLSAKLTVDMFSVLFNKQKDDEENKNNIFDMTGGLFN